MLSFATACETVRISESHQLADRSIVVVIRSRAKLSPPLRGLSAGTLHAAVIDLGIGSRRRAPARAEQVKPKPEVSGWRSADAAEQVTLPEYRGHVGA
jgi:hypothetical protein